MLPCSGHRNGVEMGLGCPVVSVTLDITLQAIIPKQIACHMKYRKSGKLCSSAALLWVATILSAGSVHVATAQEVLEAPLLRGLGGHHHAISTQNELAQRYFDQGLILMYGFNHAEAIRAFKAAATLDPTCTMAWWGIAYAEGPNINAPMMPDAYPRAWDALQKAIATSATATPNERAYVEALKSRYREEAVEDRSQLDLDFVEAMRAVAVAYPDDMDAQTVFCESIMSTMPWDYWNEDKTPKELTRELLATLQTVLRRDSNHPGANHFLIHAVEAGPSPEWGIPSADRLATIAPSAGHLVHMPSHIYVRVGQYDDAAVANEKATAADEDYLSQCRSQGLYPAGYYPHNVHFLWYANSLRGNSHDTIAAAKKVSDYALDIRCGAVEGPRLRYLHVLALAQFGKWDDVLSMRQPSDDFPFDQGMFHYARCVAWIGRGDLDAAQAEFDAFVAANTEETMAAVTSDFFPADKVIDVAKHILEGKLALARNDSSTGVDQMKMAVAIEDEISYMEPPFWYYSARWSLGAALIESKRFEEAEAVFRKDLEWLPRNGWALNGLALALRQSGKTTAASSVEAVFEKVWQSADVTLDLGWY